MKKEKKRCYSQQGGKTWPVLTSCLPLLISPSITLFAPPHLPPSLFLPWSLSFSLTLPQSYIKSYQPLEEHIKVLGPVKSYKLSALQYHYMFHPPTPLYFPFPPISEVKEFIYSDKLGRQRLNFINMPVIATVDNITLHINNRVVIKCVIQFMFQTLWNFMYTLWLLSSCMCNTLAIQINLEQIMSVESEQRQMMKH